MQHFKNLFSLRKLQSSFMLIINPQPANSYSTLLCSSSNCLALEFPSLLNLYHFAQNKPDKQEDGRDDKSLDNQVQKTNSGEEESNQKKKSYINDIGIPELNHYIRYDEDPLNFKEKPEVLRMKKEFLRKIPF